MKSIFPALTAGLFCSATLLAQTASPAGQAHRRDPVVQARELAAFRAGTANARSLAAANNVAGAEQALTPLNKARPNSAAWSLETAQRLMQTAEELARDARPAAIPALAARALQHLAQAETLARTARTRAAAKSLAGFIHERYLANRSAALAAYQGALELSPSSTAAREAVDRLRRSEEILQATRPGGGR